MRIFVSAAEISSDIHAEKILRALQNELQKSSPNEKIEWRGIAGPKVRSLENFQVTERAENLRTMGFVEVLKKYFFFKELIYRTIEEIESFKPDLIFTFDYPDFHFRVMKEVVTQNLVPNALRVCGIPPKVWVWRSKRVEKIRKLYHGVWVIFPFEKKFYESKKIPVIYEGNPLIEDLMPITQNLSKAPLETVAVMPGSRDAELKYHLPTIAKTLELFASKIKKSVQALVPVPHGIEVSVLQAQLKNSNQVEYQFLKNESTKVLAQARLGLIKSGTSTLEAAILGCVPVIFYKMNWISEQIFRWFIRYFGGYFGPIGLPNILLGVKIREEGYFKELLGPEATPERLSDAMLKVYQDESYRSISEQMCVALRNQFFLEAGSSAAERSAERILQWKLRNP